MALQHELLYYVILPFIESVAWEDLISRVKIFQNQDMKISMR